MLEFRCIFPDEYEILYQKALESFPKEYIDSLRFKETFAESLIARLVIRELVLEKFQKHNFLPQCDESQKPQSEDGIFWSISHKEKNIVVGIGDIPLGVDIEIISPDMEIDFGSFQDHEYAIVGGKSFATFFTIWTAKESVLKYQMKPINSFGGMSVVSFEQENNEIGSLHFTGKLILEDEFHEEFCVYTVSKGNLVLAVCY